MVLLHDVHYLGQPGVTFKVTVINRSKFSIFVFFSTFNVLNLVILHIQLFLMVFIHICAVMLY